jgi:D-alanyl-D-alanine carboxypeptidase (penicillin-binding protein 5/6)
MLLTMPVFVRFTLVLLLIVLASAQAAFAQPAERAQSFETSAKQAILFDVDTRAVLFERNARAKIPPASLAKIMTAAVVFRELKEGRLSMDRDMVVSTDAWRRGGAVSGGPNMLLIPNRVIKVGDLVTGLVVGNANDAAITLAENIAGTEARFVQVMNAYASELGLPALKFRNATGFLAEGQEATLHDLVQLAAHVILTYPEQYALFGQKDMPFGRNRQSNRNPLIAMDIGADGMMVGTIAEFGHLIIGSAVQEGRRLIVGLAGVETLQERANESRKLLEWGFRRFEVRTLFPADTVIGEVGLYGGTAAYLAVKTGKEIRLPVLRGSADGAQLRIAYRGPVPAPIREGQEVARLEVLVEGRVIQSSPLLASRMVGEGGVVGRAQDAVLELSRQWAQKGFRLLLETIGLARKSPPADVTGSTGGASGAPRQP